MGMKKLPKATGTPGMMNRKIWMMPWAVNSSL